MPIASEKTMFCPLTSKHAAKRALVIVAAAAAVLACVVAVLFATGFAEQLVHGLELQAIHLLVRKASLHSFTVWLRSQPRLGPVLKLCLALRPL